MKTDMSDSAMARFTLRAQRLIALARKEADQLYHAFVAPEHVLFGLAQLGQGVASATLSKLGCSQENIRCEIQTTLSV